MPDSPTPEMIDDWKRKRDVEAHRSLEELSKPDELNDLIMVEVNRIVEKVSGQCDETKVQGDIATLKELIQIRKLRHLT